MVRTGRRAAELQALLTQAGLAPASVPPAPRLADLTSAAVGELDALYTELGGTQPMPRLRPGAWDLAFTSGLVVELDEELHFNRYRAQTLMAFQTSVLPWHADYLDFCTNHEHQCLAAGRWGSRWTTRPCEAMFGLPGPTGDLDGAGAPRWKQRALYDSVKDLIATQTPTVRLARVSVWDRVDGAVLGDALDKNAVVNPERLAAFLAQRTCTAAGLSGTTGL
ncbi:hypothetical protein ACFVH4_10095 [Nocardia ignorata]|uniref:DUF7255 family protein n=1 Tax=Nocardia ignorata TaxID=145285 RepID=UPI00363036C3